MGTLLGIARFTFHEGTVDEFLRLSDECRRVVAEQDTGTLRYEIYLDRDRSRAIVIEEYVDEQALLEHGEHLGEELTAAILATADVRGELLGDLSPELVDRLGDGPVTPYFPVTSDRHQ